MAATAQRAPEPQRTVASTAPRSTGGGSDDPPRGQITAFEAELNNDNRLKSALFRLTFLLPVTILIFGVALRNLDSEIELPIINLTVPIRSVIPILLLIVAYMLFRAIRYARLVLWNIFYIPDNLSKLVDISIDDADTYKINSIYYEELLDPVASSFAKSFVTIKWGWFRSYGVLILISLNVIRSLTTFGLIFTLLCIMLFYVVVQVSSFWVPGLDIFSASLPIASERAIDIVVLALSVLLLFLSCLNASVVLFVVTGAIFIYLVCILRSCIMLLWRTPLFLPARFRFRILYKLAMSRRESRRDKALASDIARYENRALEFVSTSPRLAEYRARLSVYMFAKALSERAFALEAYFGWGIFEGGNLHTIDSSGSEWDKVSDAYGLSELRRCARLLKILAHIAPFDFITSEARSVGDRLSGLFDAYYGSSDDMRAAVERSMQLLSDNERGKLAEEIRMRLQTTPSRAKEIKELWREWDEKLRPMRESRKGLFEWDLEKEADLYFDKAGLKNAGFLEEPPIRGARDSITVTYLLNLLQRLGGASDAPA